MKRVDHETQTVVDDVDYEKFPEIVSQDGELLGANFVSWAYSREGRHQDGREFPSPIPLEPPLGYVPSKPLHEMIRDMIQREMSVAALAEGFETEEEANDFDLEDDQADPETPYEAVFSPTAPWPPTADVLAAELAAVGGAGGRSPQAEATPRAPEGPGAPAEPLPAASEK